MGEKQHHDQLSVNAQRPTSNPQCAASMARARALCELVPVILVLRLAGSCRVRSSGSIRHSASELGSCHPAPSVLTPRLTLWRPPPWPTHPRRRHPRNAAARRQRVGWLRWRGRRGRALARTGAHCGAFACVGFCVGFCGLLERLERLAGLLDGAEQLVRVPKVGLADRLNPRTHGHAVARRAAAEGRGSAEAGSARRRRRPRRRSGG